MNIKATWDDKLPDNTTIWLDWDGQEKRNNLYPSWILEENKVRSFTKWHILQEMQKYNFKIQFYEETWVLKQEGGGFDGHYNTKATLIKPIPFGVLSVSKNKKKQCSTIHVWSDGCADGRKCFLINVPNALFKEIHE